MYGDLNKSKSKNRGNGGSTLGNVTSNIPASDLSDEISVLIVLIEPKKKANSGGGEGQHGAKNNVYAW